MCHMIWVCTHQKKHATGTNNEEQAICCSFHRNRYLKLLYILFLLLHDHVSCVRYMKGIIMVYDSVESRFYLTRVRLMQIWDSIMIRNL